MLGRVRQYLLEEEDDKEVGGTRVANWELLMCVSLMMVVFKALRRIQRQARRSISAHAY